jgi:hypothetical protein
VPSYVSEDESSSEAEEEVSNTRKRKHRGKGFAYEVVQKFATSELARAAVKASGTWDFIRDGTSEDGL